MVISEWGKETFDEMLLFFRRNYIIEDLLVSVNFINQLFSSLNGFLFYLWNKFQPRVIVRGRSFTSSPSALFASVVIDW